MKYLFVLLGFYSLLFSTERPKWITEIPNGFRNDYFVGYGESKILEEAKLLSEENAKSQVRGKRSGINFSEQKITERYIEQEKDLHRVWSLVSFPKLLEEQTSPPTKTTYFLRSALLPSYAQFSKGESIKGYCIAGGLTASLVSGFVFSNLKITAESDAKNSRTQTLRDYYNDNANTYNNISLGCFIAASAIYIYNIVDAIAAEGEKIYVNKTEIKRIPFTLISDVTTKSTLLSLQINF